MRRVTAAAGAVVPLAGGTPHTIRNESGADAVAFMVHAPGAPMEGFIRAAAAAAADGAPTMDAILAIAADNGTTYSVVLTNLVGTVTTASATLPVSVAPPPPPAGAPPPTGGGGGGGSLPFWQLLLLGALSLAARVRAGQRAR